MLVALTSDMWIPNTSPSPFLSLSCKSPSLTDISIPQCVQVQVHSSPVYAYVCNPATTHGDQLLSHHKSRRDADRFEN